MFTSSQSVSSGMVCITVLLLQYNLSQIKSFDAGFICWLAGSRESANNTGKEACFYFSSHNFSYGVWARITLPQPSQTTWKITSSEPINVRKEWPQVRDSFFFLFKHEQAWLLLILCCGWSRQIYVNYIAEGGLSDPRRFFRELERSEIIMIKNQKTSQWSKHSV